MDRPSAVVTGCGQGIGLTIVRRLLADGYAVVGIDIDHRALGRAGASLPRDASVALLEGDVADPGVHEAAADQAETFGPLRAWVNNAAVNVSHSIHDVTPAVYERGLAVNLDGVFWGTAVAVRRMLSSDGGSIVNLSSILARVGFPGSVVYTVAKGGIEALTRQVAAEYAASGIRCNAIAPGLIRTPMNDLLLAEAPDPDAVRAGWDALTPAGSWGKPDDIAELAAFLLSDERAGFVTGQVIVADGGATVLAPGQRSRRRAAGDSAARSGRRDAGRRAGG